jgi:hypothetical protein
MNIQLTTEEANDLIKLMDAGVRQSGLQGAPIASVMLSKLEAAAQSAQPTTQPTTEPPNADL